MAGVSPYEKLQIESLLQRGPTEIVRGSSLVLLPDSERFVNIHRAAIAPAFRACELDVGMFVRVFDSDSRLSDACKYLASAEVIVADLSTLPSHLMYMLGLCHAMGRCPIVLTQDASALPFNLASLRFVEYAATDAGVLQLREDLTRALRVFLAATRHST